jgi:DNA-directed RNA polymerase subunit beta'
MPHLDPQDAFEHFQGRVIEGIRQHFPLTGKLQTLSLEHIEAKDELDPDDIRSQHHAKMTGESWTVPVYATLKLTDNATGKTVDMKKIRVAEIPKMTKRYSYIVDGQEYQVDNQWQLKPGVYVRRRQNGELESRFNVSGRQAFDIVFEPKTNRFLMDYGKSKLPLYPILKTMGVDDDTLEKAWGKKILEDNKTARGVAGTVERFYKADKKVAAPSAEEAKQHLYDALTNSKMRPEAVALTLGKPVDHVTGEVMRLATEKMLHVQGGAKEDDRDSLVFKDLRTIGDFAYDKLKQSGSNIRQKVSRKMNSAKSVRDIVKFGLFNEPVKQIFHKNPASRVASQVNPVEMVSSSQQTTIMGPGGIQSEQSVTDEAKFVNPSHLGFLDPIHTPEGEKTGITLRLPLGVSKVGNEPKIHLYNLKTSRMEMLSPGDIQNTRVVLPDQVKWENGKPTPLSAKVKMNMHGMEIREEKFSEATHALRHPSQLFNITSNLIPFLGNTNGNRASMATRHIEQAISLADREKPLVQVATGVSVQGIDTFENLIGKQASHHSPVEGTVTEVKKDGIVIKSRDGKKHEVQLYHYYPLNDAKSVMHSTPLVQVGAHVRAGQTVADTNFSKGGTLALGTNLRVGYLPYKGYNFEDGIVISQSAAEKLSSEHLQKHSLAIDAETVFDTKKFRVEHAGTFRDEQLKKIGDDGVVKIGTKVMPGDPLVIAMKPFKLKDRTGVAAIRRSLAGAHTDKSLRWDSDFEGTVVDTHKSGKEIVVHVKTTEPMQIGDKMAGRYGNKGIVTMILPNNQMPHTKDGKHIEVALNPSGVPGRMNIGQVLETAAGKIAQKTGKTYIVKNFEPHTDQLEKVKRELVEHGLHDTEEVFDPETGHTIGQVLVGPQHMLKLVHQVDKKLSVRSGMASPGTGEHYDFNLQPTSGSGTGGQSMGVLGMYAMLAHGAKANIREMQTWKSEGQDPQTHPAKQWQSQHNQVWTAIQTGLPLPVPTSTFAFQKFTDMLRAAGVNVEKKGHAFVLTPLTDKQVLKMSAGALSKATDTIDAKFKDGEPKPKVGGIFDEKITGGLGGRKWSHINLAEPIPNPVFEKPIQRLVGLSKKEYYDVVTGSRGVTPTGNLTDVDAGITGGAAIKMLLDRIDVKKELASSKRALTLAKGAKIDPALKKVKYLKALDELGLKPSEAYILHHLPVIPPVMRPVSVLPSGDLKLADLNGLYSEFAQVNDSLKDPFLNKNYTDASKKSLRADFYDGVKTIAGLGIPYEDQKAKQKGVIQQISGVSPKEGYFQKTLMNRRQDLTMRSTIVPEPALGLDEIGLPKDAALTLFKPFVVKKLKDMGHAPTAIEAQKIIGEKTPAVWKALESVVQERPVLLKRDPALHKYSVQAFKPKLVNGSAIQIHPLVTGGYNADFDGDTMSVFVPISPEAVAEAHKMMPSNNLFSEATGHVMYQPTLEAALGLYKLSLTGKDTGKKFEHEGAVLDSIRKGDISVHDIVEVGSHRTTGGRILLASALPEPMQKGVLHDLEMRIDRHGLKHLFTEVAQKHEKDFGDVANRLKDLGNGAAFGMVAIPAPSDSGHHFQFHDKMNIADKKKPIYIPMGTHTLSLKDFTPDKKVREAVLGETRKKVQEIYDSTTIPHADKDRRAIILWDEAGKEMQKQHEANEKKAPSNLFMMYQAGVKPGWDQYKQMVLAPMLFSDSANKTLPTPVTRSYAEGLDVGGYWNQMPGARRGSVMKVQEVQQPGYMSKLLMNNTMHVIVDSHDCGTKRGIALDIHEPDVHDRYLAEDFNVGHMKIPAGTLLSPDIVGQIKAAKKDARVVVRSPLKCESEKGLCQKCVGLDADGHVHDKGTAIGVLASHTLGERAVQLTLKEFHTGGVKGSGGGKLLNNFARFQQLTMLPQKIPNAASLAMTSGKIEKIEHHRGGADVYINGVKHFVGLDVTGMPLHENLPHESKREGFMAWDPPKVGEHVEAGDYLSDPNRTFVNPHDLYKATGNIEKVQNHMASEIYELYKKEGIRRRAVETVVKAMSNLTKVTDPGDDPDTLRGEFRPLSVIRKMNADLVKAGKNPIEHKPVLKGVDMMPLSLQEDWMAKLQHQRLKESIVDAAANNGVSLIHGEHPVPGMAFGAEFGLTKADSKKPGLKHLETVQEFHY